MNREHVWSGPVGVFCQAIVVKNSHVDIVSAELHRVAPDFVPDVENHLLAHVITAPADISNDLQNKHMTEEFYINSPVDLLYKDPSSVFWILPFVDFAMNQSTGNVRSWKKLLFMFTKFCLNNTTYFTRVSDSIIRINENTCLTSLFGFKYFHRSQIEHLLKKITKFLGRKNSMVHVCEKITIFLFVKFFKDEIAKIRLSSTVRA